VFLFAEKHGATLIVRFTRVKEMEYGCDSDQAEVPKGEEDEAIAFWVADYMRKLSGFVSSRLHRAVVPWARFYLINVARGSQWLF
jgi:hypothetical protein